MTTSKRDSSSKERVRAAAEAFRTLTGASAVDAPDAWKVFFEAVLAVATPSPARAEWVASCVEPLKASMGLVKSRVWPALMAIRPRRTEDGRLTGEPPGAASVRERLAMIDPAWGRLTQAHVERALRSRGQWMTLALLALPVEALGAKRRRGESEEAALKRIANGFKEASSVRKRK